MSTSKTTPPAVRNLTSLDRYRQSLRGIVNLSREDEYRLAENWRNGNRRAGDRIIEACLPFVISIALEYRRWGVPLEDIVQQGNLGLLKAASKFDTNKACRLATYAAYWIRAEIREHVVRFHRVVRMGTTKGERRALRAYRKTHETNPEKLADLCGLSVERVNELLPLLQARESSLDYSDDGQSMMDRLYSSGPSPEEATGLAEEQARSRASVAKALSCLSDREQMIVRERMMNDEPRTLEQIGNVLGVSKERVRQLEDRARDKLRTSLRYLHAS
jgi:RNA polymerase sigma-32 factor